MINNTYQLVSPHVFSVSFADIPFDERVIVRPEYMAVCQADQRYYQGLRAQEVLQKKLPMALIHECCGRVVYDPSGQWKRGQKVVMIPNQPGEKEAEIEENYSKGARFLSSDEDGFMREYVSIPSDRLVNAENIPGSVAAITEFVSVAVQAVKRLEQIANHNRSRIGIWGDGSLSYVTACVLRKMMPESQLIVVGRNSQKLSFFTFASETYLAGHLPKDLMIMQGFECCGGEGSQAALEEMIHAVKSRGTMILMGVSEQNISVNTRLCLEKGLTLSGISRSGKADFEKAAAFMEDGQFRKRMEMIIYEDQPVSSIQDLHRVFRTDRETMFKTTFLWNL